MVGCLYDFQRNTDAMCTLIVQDDAAILAKLTTKTNFDLETLGVLSSMMFATCRMLGRELGTEGEVLSRITIGPDYHLLLMSITPKVALVTLSRKSLTREFLESEARAVMPRIMKCLVHPNSEDRC